jgi:hypothetical protein
MSTLLDPTHIFRFTLGGGTLGVGRPAPGGPGSSSPGVRFTRLSADGLLGQANPLGTFTRLASASIDPATHRGVGESDGYQLEDAVRLASSQTRLSRQTEHGATTLKLQSSVEHLNIDGIIVADLIELHLQLLITETAIVLSPEGTRFTGLKILGRSCQPELDSRVEIPLTAPEVGQRSTANAKVGGSDDSIAAEIAKLSSAYLDLKRWPGNTPLVRTPQHVDPSPRSFVSAFRYNGEKHSGFVLETPKVGGTITLGALQVVREKTKLLIDFSAVMVTLFAFQETGGGSGVDPDSEPCLP